MHLEHKNTLQTLCSKSRSVAEDPECGQDQNICTLGNTDNGRIFESAGDEYWVINVVNRYGLHYTGFINELMAKPADAGNYLDIHQCATQSLEIFGKCQGQVLTDLRNVPIGFRGDGQKRGGTLERTAD